MAKKIDEGLVDKRAFQKYIKKGLITAQDYDDFLRSLPDESKNADFIKVFEEDVASDLTFSSVEKLTD